MAIVTRRIPRVSFASFSTVHRRNQARISKHCGFVAGNTADRHIYGLPVIRPLAFTRASNQQSLGDKGRSVLVNVSSQIMPGKVARWRQSSSEYGKVLELSMADKPFGRAIPPPSGLVALQMDTAEPSIDAV